MTSMPNQPAGSGTSGRRHDNLALAFQEVLTAIVRSRSNPQSISDAESFRSQIRSAIKLAEQEAAQRGYLPDDARLATFAVVAFLDESVLNSRNPAFASWPRKPLQEELFGVHVAGEIFFRNVERLLARPDSQELADLLEVHQLCLLLGFRGRYGLGGAGELRAITESANDKIRRIRGPQGGLSPAWAPPAEPPRRAVDPWILRLQWGAVGFAALALFLLVVFKLLLSGDVSDLQAIAEQIRL